MLRNWYIRDNVKYVSILLIVSLFYSMFFPSFVQANTATATEQVKGGTEKNEIPLRKGGERGLFTFKEARGSQGNPQKMPANAIKKQRPSAAPPAAAVPFLGFTVDPTKRTVKTIKKRCTSAIKSVTQSAFSSGTCTIENQCVTSDQARMLVPCTADAESGCGEDTELWMASYAYEFQDHNWLEIRASYKNVANDETFHQPLCFTVNEETTLGSIESITLPAPESLSDAFGADGILYPGETTTVLTFRVKHKGRSFSFFVDVNAVVEEIPTPSPTSSPTPVDTPTPTPSPVVTPPPTVTPAPLPSPTPVSTPTVSISAQPESVAKGEKSTITWNSSSATSAEIDQGIGAVDVNGSREVSPIKTTTYTITVEGDGGTASDSVTVQVRHPPVITSSPVTLATKGQLYSYDVDAVDPDIGDMLIYSLDVEPPGMSIDPATGLIQWIPGDSVIGDILVTVRVQDTGGLFATQSFTVTVSLSGVTVPDIVGLSQTCINQIHQSSPIPLGPIHYLSEKDSPFIIGILAGNIYLENFEDHLLNTPGVIAAGGATSILWGPGIHDSVDGDDGAIDGSGLQGDSYWNGGGAHTFVFDKSVLGYLPTHAGIVWTEGWDPVIFDAFDEQGALLTTIGPVSIADGHVGGLTGEDHFFGVIHEGGISAITFRFVGCCNETDHLQYGRCTYEATTAIIAANLTVGTITTETSANVPVGHVISQDPAAGISVPVDFPVSFVVSRGPQDINHPPVIMSTPVTVATLALSYAYHVEAKDPDIGDPLSFSLITAPDKMRIDGSGLIIWGPNSRSLVGDHEVVVRVEDAGGLFATQSFTITVAETNHSPSITSTPVTVATQGQLYSYDVDATDPDAGDTIAFSLRAPPLGVPPPIGMTIDATTGLIQWTPTNEQVGNTNSVAVLAHDARGLIGMQNFSITVSNVNDPPIITSAPVTGATRGRLYSYDVNATDPDTKDVLTFSLTTASAGMTINGTTGLIQWTPTSAQVGDNAVMVRVEDAGGLFATQNFTINVVDTNHSPSITSTPVTVATQGQLYTYDVNATDLDIGDVLTYSLTIAPDGMTIDPTTGLIQWTPTSSDGGSGRTVMVQVRDFWGLSVIQGFHIDVSNMNDPPAIASAPETVALLGRQYRYDVHATDPDYRDVLTYSLTIAPDGMTIDATTGLIQWMPTNSHVVTVRVEDAGGLFDTQSFLVGVTDLSQTENRPPVIISTPVTAATQGLPYRYNVDASDSDAGDVFTLIYSLTTAPAGMTIDAATGLIQWTPGNEQVGNNLVSVWVQDKGGLFGNQNFTINVSDVNDPPTITSVAVTTATVCALYSYDVEAADPDKGDMLTYSLTTSPAGMTINAATGLIQWAPTKAQAGNNNVVVRVNDIKGSTASQAFIIAVEAADDLEPPTVSVTAEPSQVDVGLPVTLTVTGLDNQGISALELAVNGTPVVLNEAGVGTFIPSAAGTYQANALATDFGCNQAMASTTFTAVVNPPVVGIISPLDGDTITGITEIIGTADDNNLDHYTLSYAPVNGTEFTEFARGTTVVKNGVLGSLDPTLLQNDSYVLRLTATDTGGVSSETEQTIHVAGNLKVGNFRLSFVDLQIPVAGIPITIIRTYDTLDAQKQGSFGYGWRMEFRDVSLRTSVEDTGLEDVFIFNPFLYDHTKVYITIPGGKREGFRFKPELAPGLKGSFLHVHLPKFVPDAGVTSKLSVTEYDLLVSNEQGVPQRGDIFLAYGTSIPYNPANTAVFDSKYTLVTKDGLAYEINARTGELNLVKDPNGNTLTYTNDGIFSSTGQQVLFERDTKGRITAIIDPMGNRIVYAYDVNGDLIAVTDREQNATQFLYHSAIPHYLEEIIDPLGRPGIRTEYDENRRLVAMVDADGNRTRLDHGLDNNTETIYDTLGNPPTYEYDNRGNILTKIDALGHVTKMTYDGNDNMLTETDPLGNTTTYTYDSDNNILTQADPLGNKMQYTYEFFHPNGPRYPGFTKSSTSKDSLGNIVSYDYDGWGNLLTKTDEAGNITTYTYTALFRGRIASITNAKGNTTSYEYDNYGNIIRETNALGNKTLSTYDANGNQLSISTTRTTNSGTELITTEKVFDKENRLIKVINADGSFTQTNYDTNGRVVSQFDELGRQTQMVYDEKGQLYQEIAADGAIESSSYDAMGRKISSADGAGFVTRFFYDSIGNLIKTVHPDGAQEEKIYDSAGQVINTINSLGNVTSYEYDKAGRNISVTDTLSQTTTFTYDAVGNQTQFTDALGRTTEYVYDELKRRTQVLFPDGTTKKTIFDNLSNVTGEIDQAGNLTQFEYDELSRLKKVSDTHGGITEFVYDELGSRIEQRDAEGRVTFFEYDNRGRLTKKTLPEGQVEITTYDEVGNVTTHVDFNGRTTTFTYDPMNRLLTKVPDSIFNAPTIEFTYDARGLSTSMSDSSGFTSYKYDERGRLLEKATPQGNLSYSYDLQGNIKTAQSSNANGTDLVYEYDQLNRLKIVHNNRTGDTIYSYDNVGNLGGVAYPNGINHMYKYDALNRPINLEVNNLSTTIANYAYTLSPTGHRLTVNELSGRSVNYTYNDIDWLASENISGSDITGLLSYTYDRVGNRLTRNSTVNRLNSQAFTYDNNDRLTNDLYDDNGNTIGAIIQDSLSGNSKQVTDVYDFENRIIDRNNGEIEIIYDGDGNRVAKIVNGTITKYLVDQNNPTGFAQVLEELSENNSHLSVTKVYTYGLDLVSQEIWDGANRLVSYYGYDGQGSVRFLTNDSGTITDQYTYDAFGNMIELSGSTPNSYLYAGEQFDEDLGLYFLRARYMEPDRGRFWTMDVFPGVDRVPISLNKYLYANANPVNFIDPSGMTSLAEIQSVLGIMSNLTNITFRFLQAIDKAKTVLDAVDSFFLIYRVVMHGQLAPHIPSMKSVIGQFNFNDMIMNLARNFRIIIGYTLTGWTLPISLRFKDIKEYLIWLPNPGLMPQVRIPINIKTSSGKHKVVFIAGGRARSGSVFGVGINFSGNNGGEKQIWRMDFHSQHPNHQTPHSDEIAVWADTPFHYHVLKFE